MTIPYNFIEVVIKLQKLELQTRTALNIYI